jgi:hypothetical protein
MVVVAQLVRASDCGSEGRGFESHLPPKKEKHRSGAFLFLGGSLRSLSTPPFNGSLGEPKHRRSAA